MAPIDPDELRPVFATRVRRTVQRVETTDHAGRPSLIEAALDFGGIEANGAKPADRRGRARAARGLARGALCAGAGAGRARPAAARDPLEVGARLRARRRRAAAWHKAEPPALEAKATVDEAIQAILRSCLQHWCANEAAAFDGSDPEGVHQMRVAIRRLRSAFSVFGRLIDPAQRARLSDEAKTIVNGLGPARDWDVFLAELLAPVARGAAGRCGPRPARRGGRGGSGRGLRAGARGDRGAAPTPVTSSSWDAGSKRAAGAISPTERGAGLVGSADRRVRHARARQAAAQGVEARAASSRELSAEERHRLRIALKKLRYATEFFEALYPKSTPSRISPR